MEPQRWTELWGDMLCIRNILRSPATLIIKAAYLRQDPWVMLGQWSSLCGRPTCMGLQSLSQIVWAHIGWEEASDQA